MSKHPANTYALVADIGGTNTRVALAHGRNVLPETIRKYPNTAFSDLESVLRQYIADEDGVDCIAACVALAGPVQNGVGELTNLDWTINLATLKHAANAETVALLNDLQAQGHALGFIAPKYIADVVAGETAHTANTKLVIGVGTGFNAAPVYETAFGRVIPPSEVGHSSLTCRGSETLGLSEFVEGTQGFAAIEDVLSGRGLERVYRWHGAMAGDDTTKAAAKIMQDLMSGTDPRAKLAVRTFVRVLGTVVGNLALINLPFGGIYLVGGVARAMRPYFDDYGFTESFADKGRFRDFMNQFSISVIEDDYAALTGCACHLTAPG